MLSECSQNSVAIIYNWHCFISLEFGIKANLIKYQMRRFFEPEEISQKECIKKETMSEKTVLDIQASEGSSLEVGELRSCSRLKSKISIQKERRQYHMQKIDEEPSISQGQYEEKLQYEKQQISSLHAFLNCQEQKEKQQAQKVKIFREFENSSQSRSKARKELSRKKGQIFVVDKDLTCTQTRIEINKQTIYFPHQPYEVQQQYMRRVLEALQSKGNALLQSPTGTGKTLCLLSSVLSWIENDFVKNDNKTKVIYMSRTHSQLKQVSKQLEKTCYRPTMAIFGSRQQLCINGQLSKLKGEQKIQACSVAIKLLQRKLLQIQRKADDNEQDKLDEIKKACKVYKNKQEMLTISHGLSNRILDVQKMRQIGQRNGFCPYFYPVHTKNEATLLVMPYNYLLNSSLFPNYKEIIADSIIIFDEAHNVAQAASQGRSFVLQIGIVQKAIREIIKLQQLLVYQTFKKVEKKHSEELPYILRDLEYYEQNLRTYCQKLFQFQQNSSRSIGLNRDQPDMKIINKERTEFDIFQMFCGSRIPDQKKHSFYHKQEYYWQQMKSRLIRPFEKLIIQGSRLIQTLKETSYRFYTSFNKFINFVTKAKQLIAPAVLNQELSWANIQLNHFRLFITEERTQSRSFTIGFKCLVPWLTFQNIMELKPRSIILTSGTLQPLQLWEKELRMTFKTQLKNKHVIKKEQINCTVISWGIQKTPFLFSFNGLNKHKDALYRELLQSVLVLCKKIPHGVLLVFPSFRLQYEFKTYLHTSPKREILQQFKNIIFQERNRQTNMQEFKQKVYSSKGVLLAMICRGRLSEGIDFPDQMCRAVIMVGIPYPNIKDPIIIEKKSHLEYLALQSEDKQKCLRGEQWYFMGTIRSLNQALGRLIRHARDYGMIFLFDQRFKESRFKTELPEWIQDSMKKSDFVDQRLSNEVTRFFKGMRQKFRTKHDELIEQNKPQNIQSEPEWQKKNRVNAFDVIMKNRPRLTKPTKEYAFL